MANRFAKISEVKILFSFILVVTKQVKYDGDVRHANMYVPELKCEHSGSAFV